MECLCDLGAAPTSDDLEQFFARQLSHSAAPSPSASSIVCVKWFAGQLRRWHLVTDAAAPQLCADIEETKVLKIFPPFCVRIAFALDFHCVTFLQKKPQKEGKGAKAAKPAAAAAAGEKGAKPAKPAGEGKKKEKQQKQKQAKPASAAAAESKAQLPAQAGGILAHPFSIHSSG